MKATTWKQAGDPMKREVWLGFEGDDNRPEWRITEQAQGFVIERQAYDGRGWESPYLGAVASVDGCSEMAKDLVEYFNTQGE
mgnify:CR=1 FL=1